MQGAPTIRFWSGDELKLSNAVTLVRCGSRFEGGAALHWRCGPRPGGALFPGDALQVAQDRAHVAFMYSYPNYIPMLPREVAAMRERLAGFSYEEVFGYTWGRSIIGAARSAVERSFDRFFARAAALPLLP